MSAEDRAASPAGETGGREETGNTNNQQSSPEDRPSLNTDSVYTDHTVYSAVGKLFASTFILLILKCIWFGVRFLPTAFPLHQIRQGKIKVDKYNYQFGFKPFCAEEKESAQSPKIKAESNNGNSVIALSPFVST